MVARFFPTRSLSRSWCQAILPPSGDRTPRLSQWRFKSSRLNISPLTPFSITLVVGSSANISGDRLSNQSFLAALYRLSSGYQTIGIILIFPSR